MRSIDIGSLVLALFRRRMGRTATVRRRRDHARPAMLERLEPRLALSASPIMLRNIAPGNLAGNPTDFVEAAGTTFFTATHRVYGRELWKTDGTTEGTVLVNDIEPVGGSNPQGLTSFNGKVYFAATEGGVTRLWSSDGTPSGTEPVNLAQNVTKPQELTVVGDTLYFAAENAGGVVGLFKITTAQPRNQVELATFGGAALGELTAFNGNLYFRGRDPVKPEGYELWISNGTREGTRLLHNINPNAADSFPQFLTPFGGFLYFNAENNNEGRELYRTNGVLGSLPQLVNKAGITGVRPGASSSDPTNLTVFNSRLYFSADGGAGEGGRELWRTTGDGTVAERVVNLNGNASSDPRELTVVNGVLYFAANDLNVGRELFRTRGGINDAQRVTVFPTNSSDPINLAVVNNRLLFRAFGGLDDELWSVPSNSATAATPVKNINPDRSSAPRSITPVQSGGVGYFSADDGTHGQELWRTDGTEAGTRLVRDTNDGNWSGIWSKMVTFGGQVFFAADDGAGGFNVELWRTDGTPAGTTLHSDLWNGGSSQPFDFTLVGSRMYFTAESAAGRFDIFRLDAPGAMPVNVTANQAFTRRPTELAAFKDRLVFSADVGGARRLWVTDGNPQNTRIWANGVTNPRSMREFLGNLYFSADVGANRKLHFLNDAREPTVNEVMNVNDVQDGVFPALGGNLYFVGSTAQHGRELWRHDGQFATRVSDINPNNFDSFPAAPFIDWTVFQNRLYFIADGGNGIGIELFRTNASGTGWEEVVGGGGVNENGDGFSQAFPPCFAQTADGFLYFSATNGNEGFELWRTDGTAANTQMIKNINTTNLSGPINLTAIGNKVYFAAIGDNSGDELWVSDGSEAGTTLVRDIAFGLNYSFPRGGPDFRDPFAVLSAGGSSRMVFWADDDVAGYEPWMLEIAAAPGAPTGISGTAGNAQVRLTWTAPAVTGGAAITNYVVQSSSNNGGTWTTFNRAASAATSATVTGLTNGTAYVFRVAAVNSVGQGVFSTPSAAVKPVAAPQAPTGISGTAGNAQVRLTWTAPAVTGGAAITNYVVQSSSNNGGTWTTFNRAASAATSATVTGLTNGTAYVFRVAAVNSVGQGVFSTPSAAVKPVNPNQPNFDVGFSGLPAAARGALGNATAAAVDLGGGLWRRAYQGGRVFWRSDRGFMPVYGLIGATWLAFGGDRSDGGTFGAPRTAEIDATGLPGGRVSHFERGSIFWSPTRGVMPVYGLIGATWMAFGGQNADGGVFGVPRTAEIDAPRLPGGRVSHFERGSIYWSPALGVMPVYGAIWVRWQALGGENSSLGLPISGEEDNPGVSGGRRTRFQQGTIVWHPSTGARVSA